MFLSNDQLKLLTLVLYSKYPELMEGMVARNAQDGRISVSSYGKTVIGTVSRVGTGFILMPMTVMKIQSEVLRMIAMMHVIVG